MAESTITLSIRAPWWSRPLISLAKIGLYLRLPIKPEAVGRLIANHIKVEVA